MPYLIGVGVSFGLIGFYLSLMTITSNWFYAKIQFERYRWWIIGISIGLGIQSILFTLLRRHFKRAGKKLSKSSLTTSGSISIGSMLLCCLHHLTDIAPLLGISIVAVTLQKYQTIFFLIGILSNLYGIAIMLRMMLKFGLIETKIFSKFYLKLRFLWFFS